MCSGPNSMLGQFSSEGIIMEQERRRLSIALSPYKDGAGQVGWALGNRGCS